MGSGGLVRGRSAWNDNEPNLASQSQAQARQARRARQARHVRHARQTRGRRAGREGLAAIFLLAVMLAKLKQGTRTDR